MRNFLLILLFIPICSFVFSQETHLIESQCGKSIMIGDIIFAAEVEEASLYEFHLWNSSFSDTILSPVNFLRYDDYCNVPLLRWTNVRVRAMVNDVWSDFSDTCSIMLVTDCGFDYKMNAFLSDDKNRWLIEKQAEALPSNLRNMNLEDSSEIVIPVIFHVIVPQIYNNPYDYLPPIKINEALNILNDVFSGTASDESTAVDTKIRFCPVESYEYQGNTYTLRIGDYCGITYNSINEKINLPENFPYSNSYRDSRDMNGFYYGCFDSNKYLNVFIYSSLHRVGVMGAAWSNRWGFGYVNVCASAIGTNDTYSRRLGYTLPHEVGHYLGLYHTWGYDSTHNDGIDDTPQHLSSNVFCDEFSDSYPDDELYDPIHNIMNYTDDGCRNHFTMGQALMMRYVVRNYYPELPVDSCSHNRLVDFFTPQILAPLETTSCTGIREITIDVGAAPYFELKIYRGEEILDTYASEDFTEQNGRYVLQYDFTDTSEYILQLVCGLDSTRTFSIRHILQTMECSGINTERNDIAQWHFDKGVSLEFRSGIAQRVDTRINATDAETSVCDSDGNLVFYTNGHVLWNSNHEISNEIQLDGCAPKSITAFHLNDNIYMLVYIDESTRSLNCKKIAVSGSNFSLLGSSSIENIQHSGLAVIPSIESGSYWIVTSKRNTTTAFVYRLSTETLAIEHHSICENSFNIDSTHPNITIKVSPDSKLIVFECPYQGVSLTRFNAHTGTLVKLNECDIDGGKSVNVAFSSNSKYMYVNEQTIGNGNNIEICQYDLSKINSCNCNLQKNVVYSINPYENEEYMRSSLFLQEGPDERIYFSKINDGFSRSQLMGVIMNPNTLGTPSVNDNECETNPEFIRYPFSSNIRNDKYLPNFIDGKPMPCDLDFNVCSVDCSNSVTIMNLSHGYDSLFSWFYVDSIGISHNFHSTELILEPEVQSICMYKTGCNDTICKSVEMNAIPNFNIIGDSNICSDDEEHIYSIDLDDSYIRSYEWRVNDLLSRTHQLVLSQSNLIGADSITIVVEVTDMMGCTKSDSITVAVDHIDYTLATDYMCDNSQLLNIVTITNQSNDSILVSMPTTNSMLGYMGTISEELENGEYTIEISNENCHYEENVNVYGLENIISSVYPYDCKGRMIKFECEDRLSNYLFYYNGNPLTLRGDSIITIGSMQGYDIVENALEFNGMLINFQVQRVGFSECSASLPVYIESVGNKYIVDTIYPYYCEANQGGFIVSLQGNIFPSVVQFSDPNNNSELIPVLIDEDEELAFIEVHGLHCGQYSLNDTSGCYKQQNIFIPDYSCAILPSASFRYNCISGKVSADVIMECDCQINEGTFVHIGQNDSVPVLVDEHNNPYIVLDSLEIATEYNCNIEWDNGCQSEFSISTPDDVLYMEIAPTVDEYHCLSVTFNSNYDNIFNVSIPDFYEQYDMMLNDTTINVQGTCNIGNLFSYIYVNDSLNSCNFIDSVKIVKEIDISVDTSSFYCNGIGISVNGGTPPYTVTITSDMDTTELIVSENDVFHYSDMSHNSPLVVFIFDRYNNSETKNIDMPQANYLPMNLYSGPVNYSDGVYIATQAGLNINCNVSFSNALIYCYSDDANISNSQWTVNAPYELKFENCTIRACPDKMWQGIEVTGDDNVAHALVNRHHGKVICRNNTAIEDAINALESTGGGIISATDSHFNNNKNDIVYNRYQFTHSMSTPVADVYNVYNCTFSTTRLLNDNSIFPESHIYMDNVKGLLIGGSTFENMVSQSSSVLPEIGTPYYTDCRGVGIRANSSSFEAKSTNTFDGLYYGVYASGLNAVHVKNSTFTGNYGGIYINRSSGSKITGNSITASGGTPTFSTIGHHEVVTGAYLNSCTAYTFEDNTISNATTGLQVNNSGTAANKINSNTFVGAPPISFIRSTYNGILVTGRNADNSGRVGLELLCNDFSRTTNDMGVKDGYMRRYQGGDSLPTGNQFLESDLSDRTHYQFRTQFSSGTDWDVYRYEYYQHDDYATGNINRFVRELCTGHYSNRVRAITTYYIFDTTYCQCNSGGGVFPPNPPVPDTLVVRLMSRIQQMGTTLAAEERELESKVDGGNTTGALMKVSSISQGFTPSIMDFSQGGYISDTVCGALIDKMEENPVYVASVFVENSPLPAPTYEDVQEAEISQILKTVLSDYQSGENARVADERTIGDIKQKISLDENVLYVKALNDSLAETDYNAVLNHFSSKTDIDSKLMACNILVSADNYEEARRIASNIRSLGTIEASNCADVVEMNIGLEDATITKEMLVEKRSQLEQYIADNNYLYSGMAENLYEYVFDTILPKYTPLFEDELISKSVEQEKQQEPSIYSIYPNPTSDCITVILNKDAITEDLVEFVRKYGVSNGLEKCDNIQISLYDINRRLLETQNYKYDETIEINAIKYPAGTYLVEIISCYGEIILSKVIKL